VKSRDGVRFSLRMRYERRFRWNETGRLKKVILRLSSMLTKRLFSFEIQLITLVFSRRFRWPGRCTPRVDSFL
jgi:hypothetical protein